MPKDKPELDAPKAEVLRLPPLEWAKRRGLILDADKPANPVLGTGPRPAWQHAAADAVHGWSWHAEQYQAEPLEITEADYVAAVDAACKPTGLPQRHAPAASPRLKE